MVRSTLQTGYERTTPTLSYIFILVKDSIFKEMSKAKLILGECFQAKRGKLSVLFRKVPNKLLEKSSSKFRDFQFH